MATNCRELENEMRGIADTIARLTAAAARSSATGDATWTVLQPLEGFGSNPGALKAFVYIPGDLPTHSPLVVVLHGCTQSAAVYDRASGWSQLAAEQGFALLYAEQQRSNNAMGCFNWFEADDNRRGGGEALSIRQMIAAVQERNGIDPRRIFVTGLSAGGAMTSTMLATYPDVFAGGAIIAGLPYGAATGLVQAFDRMRGHGLPSGSALEGALREASDHAGPWPRISVWHGSADATVGLSNAEAIVSQWRAVHGLSNQPSNVDRVDNVPHRTWRGSDGLVLVEDYIVPGMSHGTPLKTQGTGAYGSSAPFMLDVGISSTLRIAQFWEIAPLLEKEAANTSRQVAEPTNLPARIGARRPYGRRIDAEKVRSVSGVGRIIEDALRAAGLMK
jgi:poly(hydroxyalkanoate) depolymerase family esterase